MESLESNSTLPDSWINVEWSQITALDGFRRGPFGGNLKKSCFVEQGYSVYEQYAPINDDCTSFRYFIDEEKYQELSGFHVNEGDFLISCSGTMGRITHVPDGSPSGVINQALLRIRLQDQFILPDYFLKLFRSPLIQNSVLNKTVGGAIQNLAAVKELKTIPLPIAPLPEQKRIVEKLDSLLAQVDTIQQRLNNLPDIIKRFRQSVLAAAVSGKLTEQWRGENRRLLSPLNDITKKREELIKSGAIKLSKQNIPLPFDEPLSELPEWWDWARLISISLLVTDGKHGNCVDEANSGYYFLSAKDVKNGKLHYLNAREINQKEFQEVHQRTNLEAGDICIVNTGATVGKLAIAQESPLTEKSTFQKSVAVIKLIRPYMNEKYMSFYLRDASERLLKSSTGSAVNNLLLSTMKQMAVPVPPVEEQTEIARLVEQYFALADTLEKNLANAKTRVDNLTQSILAKAFKGELVPQDPSDEPADKLLERIKAARIEAEKLEKAAKKAAKVSKAKTKGES